MNLLKYKYKAHKLVNTLFYIIVFLVGFVLGFGAKKLDFSNLISQVLMIDNAKAYTIYTYNDITVNEDFIYERFVENKPDFDLSVYPYIYCNIYYQSAYASDPAVLCVAFKEEKLSPEYLKFYYKSSQYHAELTGMVLDNGANENPDVVGFNYRLKSLKYSSKYPSSLIYSTSANFFTNFDKSNVSNGGNTTISDSKFHNVLDFSKYSIKIEYNENLFKDNPDFKQICVTSDTRFAITSNNITYNDDETELKYFNGIDFIWFSYVPDGLTTYLYSSAEETKKTPLTEDGPLFSGINPGYWYYLDDKDEIDKFFNTNSSKGEIYPGVTLETEGYTNKYSYFGWYFHPFVVHFDNTPDGNNIFNVFHFKDKLNFYSTLENGLDYYEELEEARNGNICFYIKNSYDITILNKDIFDDDIGSTTILGGDNFNINTTENFSSLNSKGLFSKINSFINNIKDTISFINSYIYELYISMPIIVQLFIISIFGLIVVRILIGMVTK